MARGKFNPLGSLEELRDDVNSVFETYLGGLCPSTLLAGRKFPPVAIWESDTSIFVQAEIPGVSLESVEVYAHNNTLTIKGYRPPLDCDKSAVLRQEHYAGDFTREIELPIEVDPDQIEASMKEGLLTITLTKPEVSTARRIHIRPPMP